MTVKVKLFAMLRERAGTSALTVEIEEGSTADQVTAELGRQAGLTDLLDRLPVVMAVNREYVHGDALVHDGDELALIPPVSGGAAGDDVLIHVRVTGEPLSADRVSELVRRGDAGAIVTFQGTTRTVDRLDYEAYSPMAEEKIEEILRETAARHELLAVAAEHRTGAVATGESSVVIAAAAAHRAEAFNAAREVLDRIKSEAPVWKREVTGEGEDERTNWVEGNVPSPKEQMRMEQVNR